MFQILRKGGINTMAIVKGPLFSMEARGKIADCMVHFPWKGRAVVRRWLKPTNPRDVDQKLIRQKLAAIGRATAVITSPCTAMPNGSALVVAIKAKTPAAQIWNAYLVKKGLYQLTTDATYIAEISAIVSSANQSTVWGQCATELGFEALTGDQYATTIPAVDQLAMAAWAAYQMNLSDATNIYSTHPCNWVTAVVSQFATDFTAAY